VRSDAKLTPFLLIQPTEGSPNSAPLPPPLPLLEGEDTKVPRAMLGYNRQTVPDTDLDVSVDLGEAVARTPTLKQRSKSRSVSPMLPDYLSMSMMHDVTLAPVIRTQQSGERKKFGHEPSSPHSHPLYACVQPPLPLPPPTRLCRCWLLGLRHASLL
jgi:hypothetical protein